MMIDTASQPRRTRNREHGVAMLLVIMAVAAAAVLAMGFLHSQSTNQNIVRSANNVSQARSIAIAGIEMTISTISKDTNWRSNHSNGVWATNASLMGGTVTISVTDGTYDPTTGLITGDGNLLNNLSDPFVITAKGTYNNCTQTLNAGCSVTSFGGLKMVMVVPNPSSLSTEETARQTLLTSWGWTVVPMSDSSSASAFATAATTCSIFYIPMSATNASLGTNIAPVTSGIVCENASLASALKISAATPVALSTNQIKSANYSDYITLPFGPLTAVTLTSSSQPLQTFSSWAAGALPLATVTTDTTKAMLISVETGAALTSGTAPGRRVILPWGQNTFSISSLSTNGQTLMQRACEWTAGSLTTSTSTGAAVSDYLTMKYYATLDGYKSSSGSYGGSNSGLVANVATNSIAASKITVGSSAVLTGNAHCGPGGVPTSVIVINSPGKITGTRTANTITNPIPSVTIPSSVPAVSGALSLSTGTTTWSSDKHYSTIALSGTAIVDVTANINVVADSTISLKNSAMIRVQPGGQLNLYPKYSMTMSATSQLNMNSGQPSLAKIQFPNANTFTLSTSAQACATTIGPSATLSLRNTSQYYGTFQGYRMTLAGTSTSKSSSTAPSFHQDIITTVIGSGAVSSAVTYNYTFRLYE